MTFRDSIILSLKPLPGQPNNPSTDRRRFSLRLNPPAEETSADTGSIRTGPESAGDDPVYFTNPFTGEAIAPSHGGSVKMADAQRLSPTRVTFNIPIETQQEPADPRLLGMSHQPASRSPLLYNLEAKKRCINSELYTILRRDGLSGVNPADSAQLQDLLERIVPQTNEARRNHATCTVVADDSPARDNAGHHGTAGVRYTRFERPFVSSGTTGNTVWYTSSSGSPLHQPAPQITPSPGNIYIHTDASTNGLQVWISLSAGSWKGVPVEYDRNYLPDRVVTTARHPLFNDRVLKIRANGEPSWVTRQTCVTLKSRKKVARAGDKK